MVKPQQPELRRSEYGATSEDAIKGFLTAQDEPVEDGNSGPVPADNQPGHHPEVEQDQPSGDDFVARARGDQ